MPNKISEWLRNEVQRLANEANAHFGTELECAIGGDALICKELAELVDRLVEAAEALATKAKLTDDYQEWYGGSLHCAVHQLTAILGEIENEAKDESTN